MGLKVMTGDKGTRRVKIVDKGTRGQGDKGKRHLLYRHIPLSHCLPVPLSIFFQSPDLGPRTPLRSTHAP